jgi:hypothetical protein
VSKKHQNVQDTLSNDYTGVAILIGALMIATAFVFMWLSVTFPFSITALVWGSIIVCASLFFRHKAMDKRVRHCEAVLKLERERTTYAHRQAMLQSILDHGLPEEISWEQLQALLDVPAQMSEEEQATEPS